MSLLLLLLLLLEAGGRHGILQPGVFCLVKTVTPKLIEKCTKPEGLPPALPLPGHHLHHGAPHRQAVRVVQEGHQAAWVEKYLLLVK